MNWPSILQKKNLRKLVGHRVLFSKLSKHFVEKIKNVKMEDGDVKVSFNIVTLHTKTLVHERLKHLRSYLTW